MKTMRNLHTAAFLAMSSTMIHHAGHGHAHSENTAGTNAHTPAAPEVVAPVELVAVPEVVAKTAEQIAAETAALKAAAKAETDRLKAVAKGEKEAAAKTAKDAKAKASADAKLAKETAVADAKAAKELAAKTAAETKAAAVVVKPVKVAQPQQHGVTRPRADGACGQVWALADAISKRLGQPVPIAQLSKETAAAGLNDATTRTQYARWKTFNGVFGAVPKIAEAVAPAPVAPAATVAETAPVEVEAEVAAV